MTWPLVRLTVPVPPMMTVLAFVVTLPTVKVSVPLSVRSPPAMTTPLVLLMVALLMVLDGGISTLVVRGVGSCA